MVTHSTFLDMKNVLPLVFIALLLCACQESLEDRCAREAREYTQKHCPVAVGDNIVLDSMTFDKSTHTIYYIYTLKGVLDNNQWLQQSHPRESLLMEVKNSTHLKLYKEAGYSFCYRYNSESKKGTQLFEATFHQSDYQ